MKGLTLISLKLMSIYMKKWLLIILISLVYAQNGNSITGAFGTVTMDGKIWNQLSFRPEIPLGNFGLAMDLVFYFDENGTLHKEEWDFSDGNAIKNTLIDKIYYLRYGYPGDPLYGKIGALDHVVLGYGILVDGYSNSIEYPQVRKVGMNFEYSKELYSFQGFVNDFKENIGLIGLRMQTASLLAFPIGISAVFDRNQFLGLKDSDGDGRPNLVDHFPDNDNFWIDSDGDGYADNDYENEFDRDGDGLPDREGDSLSIHEFWDNLGNGIDEDFSDEPYYDTLPDGNISLLPEPLNINNDADQIFAFSIDLGYPVLEKENFSLIMYAQFAKMIGETRDPETDSTVSLGSGIIPLGLRAKLGPINCILEYRTIPNGRFDFGYWNRSYELERATISQINSGSTSVFTKESKLGIRGKQKGLYFGIQSNVFNILSANISFQTLNGEQWDFIENNFIEESNQSLQGSLSLNKEISRLSRAELFYQQKNVPNPFDFSYTESTIMGYRLGISMGDGLVVNYIFKRMFKDTNGNGVIDDSEAINLTGIETSFNI